MSDFLTHQFPNTKDKRPLEGLARTGPEAQSPNQEHRGFSLSYFFPPPKANPAGTRALTSATARSFTNRAVARMAKMPSSFRSRASSYSIAILAVLHRAFFKCMTCRECDCWVTLYASERGESRQILPRFGRLTECDTQEAGIKVLN
jgi:hypothetical protein